MLLHGPEDRNVFLVEKRDYSMYAIKEVIGANCTQGGQKRGGFSVHLILLKALAWRCIWMRWHGIAVLGLQNGSPPKDKWGNA
jgi:hypothetical protein